MTVNEVRTTPTSINILYHTCQVIMTTAGLSRHPEQRPIYCVPPKGIWFRRLCERHERSTITAARSFEDSVARLGVPVSKAGHMHIAEVRHSLSLALPWLAPSQAQSLASCSCGYHGVPLVSLAPAVLAEVRHSLSLAIARYRSPCLGFYRGVCGCASKALRGKVLAPLALVVVSLSLLTVARCYHVFRRRRLADGFAESAMPKKNPSPCGLR